MSIPSSIDIAFEVNPERSDGEVARVKQMGYTESEEAESVANVAPGLLTNFNPAATWLDFPAAPLLARD
jgi:hypothetical protein